MADKSATQQKEFTITRVFDAPREILWRAWTDPDEAAQWWHPRNVRTPRESVRIDARVGGSYEYMMIAPDGTEFPTSGEYLEVVEPERLVFTWGMPTDSEAPVITVVLTETAPGQTEMMFHLRGADGQPGDYGVYDGWASAFEILTEHLS
ncbi:uncharacterized protein YndB with AHSA1/START domain [Antricoccus suffuscus]|uniref:Uncharacterized protein YndB with AHSA1/START domain n=1 Tax=Antricoccus suffuscus TaxID=1629062 RepID=A0A2T1A333_9ACTN|nr:SRPBCC domain-containing protein [Antricoccus suffuscus]PRZ42996.1 uncharacterized protein YndB with AHSA1/START domain [Antricoccus suffuscus]